jgi:outer membrane receptor protein involved in Fe transport
VGNGRQNYIALYLQDTWKVNNKLTVNAGIRWEPFLPGWKAHGQTAHFEREAFDKGIKSTGFKNAPAGLQFPPLRGSQEKRSGDGRTNKYHNNQWPHFVRLQSGSYFTVTSGTDITFTNTQGSQRADQVLANPYAPKRASIGGLIRQHLPFRRRGYSATRRIAFRVRRACRSTWA